MREDLNSKRNAPFLEESLQIAVRNSTRSVRGIPPSSPPVSASGTPSSFSRAPSSAAAACGGASVSKKKIIEENEIRFVTL
jgi:hypothetical protein